MFPSLILNKNRNSPKNRSYKWCLMCCMLFRFQTNREGASNRERKRGEREREEGEIGEARWQQQIMCKCKIWEKDGDGEKIKNRKEILFQICFCLKVSWAEVEQETTQ